MFDHVASVNGQSQAHVCGLYFSFTRDQRDMILPISFPTDQSTRAHDNGSAHAIEFNEWQVDALADHVVKL